MPRRTDTSNATITLGDLLGGKNILILGGALLAVGGAWARVEIGLGGAASKSDVTALSEVVGRAEKQSNADHEKFVRIDPTEIRADHEVLRQLQFEQKATDTSAAKTSAQIAALEQLMKSIEQAVNTILPRTAPR